MDKQHILTKVPGDLSYGRAKEKQGYIQDISKLNKSELLDLKERQELLLRNTKQIMRLPDKGLKVKNFYDQILRQLELLENIDHAAEMFSKFNIASVENKSVMQMEWRGKHNALHEKDVNNVADIDDDRSKNRVLSSNGGQINIERQQSADNLELDVREKDDDFSIVEKQSGNSYSRHKHLLKKKPVHTTESITHDTQHEKCSKGSKKRWENTSATPPTLSHSPVKVLSLKESVQLQEVKNNLIMQAKKQYAAERLLQRQENEEKIVDSIHNDVM